MDRQPSCSSTDTDLDLARVEQYPVRLVVLFGSHARGASTPQSDVDIAVAFEEGLSPSTRLELRISLVVDLVRVLGTDDVDVADLEEIRPEVGASALEAGILLLGDPDLFESMRDRFRGECTATDETREERLRRFDSILERLEGRV